MRTPASGIMLILGGARAGKSAYAERLAADYKAVTIIATAEAIDEEMLDRIMRHRAVRPPHWTTIEEPIELVAAARRVPEHHLLLIDCLTVWVGNLLLQAHNAPRAPLAPDALKDLTDALLGELAKRPAPSLLISNEVGMGIVPPTFLGRTYRDHLGRVNSQVANAAARVELMIAGQPLRVKG